MENNVENNVEKTTTHTIQEELVTPFLQLRQDDVVAIPIERYEYLVNCETRLHILRDMRLGSLARDSNPYLRDEDYILGSEIPLAIQKAKNQRKQEAGDE